MGAAQTTPLSVNQADEETAVQQQQSSPLSEVTLVAEVPEQQEQQASTHSSSHPAPLERSTSLANALSGIEDVGALLSHDNRPPPPRASTAFPLAASASSSSSSSSLLSSSSSFTLERSTTVPVQEFKIIVVGDANTGKTSLIHRYVLKQFQSVYKTTIGVDFASRIVTVNGQYSVSVQLWDICGHERFGSMMHVFYKEADAAIVTFDCQVEETLERAERWIKQIQQMVFLSDGSTVPIFLAATKCDQPHEPFCVDDNLRRFCLTHSLHSYHFTSAKYNLGIEELFAEVVPLLIATRERLAAPPQRNSLQLRDPPLTDEGSSRSSSSSTSSTSPLQQCCS